MTDLTVFVLMKGPVYDMGQTHGEGPSVVGVYGSQARADRAMQNRAAADGWANMWVESHTVYGITVVEAAHAEH